MNIKVFISDVLIVPFEEENTPTTYQCAWQGTTGQLGIETTDETRVLDAVFFAFNHDNRPAGFGREWRSFSVGDVVSVEERAYQCLAEGWRAVKDFLPGEELKRR